MTRDKVLPMRSRTSAELAFDSCFEENAGGSDFLRLGLPNKRVESWKYTDLRGFLSDPHPPLRVSETCFEALPDRVLSLRGGMDCACFVFVNGVLHMGLSDIAGIESNIEIVGFDDFSAVFDGDILTPPAPDRDSVMSLTLGLADRGLGLRLSGDIARPIGFLYIHDGSGSSIVSRNFIVLAPDCRAVLFERHVSLSSNAVKGHVHMGMSDVYLGSGSALDHVVLQSRVDLGGHIWNYNYALGEDSRLVHCGFGCGSGLSRHQLYVRYDGMGADARISGGCHVSGSRHYDMTLVADHGVGGCMGRELFKAVIDDLACAVFQGKIIVRPDAQKTDSQQSSHALLLGEGCEFKTKPELEIYADDVVCGHGATSGRLDRDMIFYLCSRGISESEARSLLICAFLNEIFSEIGSDDVRSYLESFVSSRISSLGTREAA